MDWEVGMKAIALYDIWIIKANGDKIKLIIEHDKIYLIKDIQAACCMLLLDVGKMNTINDNAVMYMCGKCHKSYIFLAGNKILFHEGWFKPVDENESKLAKAFNEFLQIFHIKKVKEIVLPTRPIRKVPNHVEIPTPAEVEEVPVSKTSKKIPA